MPAVAAVCLLCALSLLPAPSETQLVDFELEDQHGVSHSRAQLAGKSVVLVGSNRAGRPYNRPWGDALRDALANEDQRGDVIFVRVADLRAVPPFVRPRMRKRMASEEDRLVLLDWQGQIAQAHDFDSKSSNILVADPAGRLVFQTPVRELDETLLRQIVGAVRSAHSNPPPE